MSDNFTDLMAYLAPIRCKPKQIIAQHLNFSSNGEDWINALRHHAHYNMKGGTFGHIIGLCVDALPKNHISPAVIDDLSSLKMKYRFPSRVVSPYHHEFGESVDLPLIMSVFDEVSSWNLFHSDKTRRPGVSVHLSADAHWDVTSPPLIKDEYEITSTLTSSGRQLGFLSLELRKITDNKLIASGKHIKFLPMPGVGPNKIVPWDRLFGSTFAAPHLLSNLAKSVSSHIQTDDHSNDTEAKLEQWFKSMETSHNECSDNFVAMLKSTKEHCNVMGTIHGGFQAVFAEACARQHPLVQHGSLLLSISTEYLSAHRPGIVLKGTSRARKNSAGQQVVHVAVSDNASGKISSNSTLLFDHTPISL